MYRWIDSFLIRWGAFFSAVVAGLIVLVMTLFVLVESSAGWRQVSWLAWISDDGWVPDEGSFNLLPMIVATILTTCGAVLIATPLGIGSALFARHYGPGWLTIPFRQVVSLLAGIPSVVYGFWGLVVLTPLIARWSPPGAGLLTGVLVLTLMIVPTVTLFTDSALKSVSSDIYRNACALGLSKSTIIWSVLLPAARKGVLTGILLAAARAIGETMALLMVCGNVVQYPSTIYSPIRTLTANIALEMGYALGDHRSALFVSGLALVMLVFGLVGLAEWLGKGVQRV